MLEITKENKRMYKIGNKASISPYKKTYTSAQGFIKMVETKRDKIKNIRFIPPKLGSKSFGKFYVELDESI